MAPTWAGPGLFILKMLSGSNFDSIFQNFDLIRYSIRFFLMSLPQRSDPSRKSENYSEHCQSNSVSSEILQLYQYELVLSS